MAGSGSGKNEVRRYVAKAWPSRQRRRLKRAFADGRSPTLWFAAIFVGLVAGYATIGLRMAIEAIQFVGFGAQAEFLATAARELSAVHLIMIPILAGAVVSALLYIGHRFGWLTETRALGISDVMEARAVHGGKMEAMPGLLSALIAAVSLGGGASTGREGPAVHLGATMASLITRPLGLPARGARIMLACGAAAAVSASFNAPVAGALFAFEVILGHYALRSIAPVAVASVIGAIISRLHYGAQPSFTVPEIGTTSLIDFAITIPLGFAAALVAIVFVMTASTLPRLVAEQARAIDWPIWALPPFGGLLIGLIAVAMPEILGVGYEAITSAIAGQYGAMLLIGLLLVKILATVITLAFRFGGGVFAPSLYLGAMLGGLFGVIATAVFGDQTSGIAFFAVVGMGAVSGAVLGAPLSTTLIVFELTASYETSIALLVAVSLATVLTTTVTKGSYFHKLVERHGYDLTKGDARVILQTIRVRDVMTVLDRSDAAGEMEETHVYDDDYLGRVMGFFSAEKIDGAVVRSRHGDQPIVGYISKADAHAAYATALQHRHEEEHQ